MQTVGCGDLNPCHPPTSYPRKTSRTSSGQCNTSSHGFWSLMHTATLSKFNTNASSKNSQCPPIPSCTSVRTHHSAHLPPASCFAPIPTYPSFFFYSPHYMQLAHRPTNHNLDHQPTTEPWQADSKLRKAIYFSFKTLAYLCC